MAVWADVSEHNNTPVDSSMPYAWFAFRVCDGTYLDKLAHANLAGALRLRQLVGMIAYAVYPRSIGTSPWRDVYNTYTAFMGPIHRPKLVIMQDVESWGRADLRRDHSADIEALRAALVNYLHSLRPKWQRRAPWGPIFRRRDRRRVIGYGNRGDLTVMARNVKWASIVLADYSAAPTPKKLGAWAVVGRQYTDAGKCPPWGHCDMNRSDLNPQALARTFGLGTFKWSRQ